MLRIFVVLMLFCHSVIAENLPVFPESSVFESVAISETRFDLALGGMEKKNGEWLNEKSTRVAISGQRVTFEIGRNVSVNEVFAFYQNYFKPNLLKPLYRCESLDCGSSAQWANGYFGVRELYGIDNTQRLAIWLVNGENGQKAVTMYVVQRGNKRVYAHLDLFDLAEPILSDSSPVSFLSDVFNVETMTIDQLRDLAGQLRSLQNNGLVIMLVGHSYVSSDIDENRAVGLKQAQALADRLTTLGVEGLSVESAGMLAPQGEAAVNRVSVITRKP